MSEIKAGDIVVLTSEVEVSDIYPFVKEGTVGLVTHVHPSKTYPFSVVFEGTHAVDTNGCPVIVKDPILLFDHNEIALKADA